MERPIKDSRGDDRIPEDLVPYYRTPFKKALLQFITEPDPFLAMLQWVMAEMMRIEAETKVGATKVSISMQK